MTITSPTGDRTGEAAWVPLNQNQVEVDAVAAATAAGATGYNRPEDLEIATSTGNNHGGNVLYLAITGPGDNHIIAIDLRQPMGGRNHTTVFVYDYVKVGLNAPSDFEMPDNLALNKQVKLHAMSFRNMDWMAAQCTQQA